MEDFVTLIFIALGLSLFTKGAFILVSAVSLQGFIGLVLLLLGIWLLQAIMTECGED